MASSSFENIVENYIDEVKHITKIRDAEFFIISRKLIFDLFGRVKSSEIKGIVVGIIFHENLPKKKGGYFISSGRSKQTDCQERNQVLEGLKEIYLNENGILFIRFPFFASDNDTKFNLLASAFEPLFQHLLQKIVDCKNRKSISTPILTLGYRAAKSTYDCLKKTNRPQFVVFPTVHPNFFAEMSFEISQCVYEVEHIRYLDIIEEELKKFNVMVKNFKSAYMVANSPQ